MSRFTVRAPGRVNLIGGHVDFHDGAVVAAAIDRFVDLAVVGTGGEVVELTSSGFPGRVRLPADGGPGPASVEPAWGRLVAAVLAELGARGRPPVGFRGELRSNLPAGGGLSSSAAFELAVGLAAAHAAAWDPGATQLAVAAQAAEAAATGVPCGIQDQLAVLTGGVAHLDCRSLDATPLSLPAGTSVLVVDSGSPRTLEGSPWAARRAASFAEARAMGVERFRELAGTPLDEVSEELALARHVLGELDRVERFASALRAGDAGRAGRFMVESHASSRDLWCSSTPELDLLVDLLVDGGAHGARLTGGGFGGCVVALVGAGAEALGSSVARSYRERTGLVATAHHVVPAPGLAVL